MIPFAETSPTKIKNFFFSKLHNANSQYGVWTAL